ncbi:MAG: L-histidine N(alpha)-methyltransferase [Actinomycetota bacterium]|nr:L-histidine N(alpha)-methyltransferase [Actinomycetota bacterium]
MKLEIEVFLSPDELHAALRNDVATGLVSVPKEIPPKWFYDDRGSELFTQITRLPEYYQTRKERAILDEVSYSAARLTRADTLVELGSGTSEKTALLLDALDEVETLERFVPFDVNEATLRQAATAVAKAYPRILVHAVVGDFEHHLQSIPGEGRRLVAFLGGTIGNLRPEARSAFLADLSATMEPGDALLLGVDLVKNVNRLLAAYDDSAGVTADFNRNVLRVINRELGADFAPERFDHVVRFDDEQEWIEMWLRATEDQFVTVRELGTTAAFDREEEMRTEISAKFRRSGVDAELADAELTLGRWWTDPDRDFALALAFKE